MPPSSPAPRLSAASDLIAQEDQSQPGFISLLWRHPDLACRSLRFLDSGRKAKRTTMDGFAGVLMNLGSFWVSPLEQVMILGGLPTLRGAKPLLPALPSIPQELLDTREGLCPPGFASNSCYSWDWLFRSLRDILKDQFLGNNQQQRDLRGHSLREGTG